MFQRRKTENPWDGKLEPFKLFGNVYFCGTLQASCHLIDTGDGLILIDPGYANTLYLVIDSIYKLGFKPEDIKYIVNTHWHGDHTEATAALVGLAGAKTLIGHRDEQKAKRYFDADILVKDGDVLSLGNTTFSFMETPGHTAGTVSFFFNTTEGENTYRVGMFGGAGANTLVQGKFDYEGCREDYRASVRRLQKETVDVMLGNHVWNNDTAVKGELLLKTGENRFVDPQLWHTFLTFCENRLDAAIAKDI